MNVSKRGEWVSISFYTEHSADNLAILTVNSINLFTGSELWWYRIFRVPPVNTAALGVRAQWLETPIGQLAEISWLTVASWWTKTESYRECSSQGTCQDTRLLRWHLEPFILAMLPSWRNHSGEKTLPIFNSKPHMLVFVFFFYFSFLFPPSFQIH